MPSGLILKVTPAPFTDANELYKAIARECRGLDISSKDDLNVNFIKGIFCVLVASDEVEKRLWKCFERVTYNGVKITLETLEDEKARGDYFTICKEVATINVTPFLKSLYAEFVPLVGMIQKLTRA